MKNQLVVLGGGEHARVVIETALAADPGIEFVGYISPEKDPDSEKRFSVPYLGDDNVIPDILRQYPSAQWTCGMGNNSVRAEVAEKAACVPDDAWAVLIHPSAVVASGTSIEKGSVIFARAVLQTGAEIGKHVIINSGAVVEHDVIVGNFVHIAPGALIGGGVSINNSAFIGLGARVRDHVQIGNYVTVGTGSVVVSDIPDEETVVGVPARRLSRTRKSRDVEELCIPPATTLYEAMSHIAQFGAVALVTDPEMKLLGLLNDSDIRSALLKNYTMDTPVEKIMNRDFFAVNQKVPRVAALDQLKATGHRLMPILDDEGRVAGLHLIDSMIGSQNLPNIAVIMAGGKGVRLRPITENIPKPMVRVAGRPILEHIVLHLAGAGIRKIFIAVNYLSEMIEEYFGNGSRFGVEIAYLREEKPLGTAGALKLIPDGIKEPMIVMNGDLITQFDVERMLHSHRHGGYALTIGSHDYRMEIPYGVIEWDDSKEAVTGLREKPEEHFLVNGGIYVVNPELTDFIEPDRNIPITELIEKCLKKNYRVGVHLIEGDWIDVGQHSQLAAARGIL